MHGDMDVVDLGGLQVGGQFILLFGIKAEVGVYAEHEEAVTVFPGTGKQLDGVFDTSFGAGIVTRPQLTDAQVGIGVEAFNELGALVENVRFDLVVNFVPREAAFGLIDVFAGAPFDGVEVDKGFMADHSRQGETVGRRWAIVVGSTRKVRIVLNRQYLFEQDQAIEDSGAEAAGDRHNALHAFGEQVGKGESTEAADGRTDCRVQFFDTELVEKQGLGAHNIVYADFRKACTVGFSRFGIHRGWARRAVAAAEKIYANYVKAFSVYCSSWTNEIVPPSCVQLSSPAFTSAIHLIGEAGCVVGARKGVEQQHRVAALGIELSVSLIGETDLVQRLPAGKAKWFAAEVELGVLGSGDADRVAHGKGLSWIPGWEAGRLPEIAGIFHRFACHADRLANGR